MQLYLHINDEVQGPFDADEVQALLEACKIGGDTPATMGGTEAWMPLGSIPGFSFLPASDGVQISLLPSPSPTALTDSIRFGGQNPTSVGPVCDVSRQSGKKTCPFCGLKKVQIDPAERQFKVGFHIRRNRICQACGAIWMPRVGKQMAVISACCIFAVLLPTIVVLASMWLYSFPLIHRRYFLEDNVISAAKILCFIIGGPPFFFFWTQRIIRRAFSNVRDDESRKLTVVRNPVR